MTATRWARCMIGGIGGLLLAGCVNAGTPTDTNATTTAGGATIPAGTSASASSAPVTWASATGSTSTGLSIPADARVDSVDGAVAFVRFAAAQVNLAYRLLSPAPLDLVHSPECPSCARARADVAAYTEQHLRTVTDVWTVTFTAPDTWRPGHATVELHVHQNRVDLVDDSGHRVDVIDSGDYRFLVTLAYDGRWRITRWQPLA